MESGSVSTGKLVSPADLPADADGKLPFWRPSYGQIVKSLRWQWLRIVGLTIGILFILLGTLQSRGFWWWAGSVWMWASIGFAVTAGIADTLWQATKKSRTCIASIAAIAWWDCRSSICVRSAEGSTAWS